MLIETKLSKLSFAMLLPYFTILVVNYGISNTIVLEIP